MTRTRIGLTLSTAVLGMAGLLGIAAYGQGSTAPDTAQAAEPQALTAMGLNAPLTDPASASASASPSASPSAPAAGKKAGGHGNRGVIRRNTLHGEMVVKARGGTKTVDFQRGTVTAIDDKSVTVKSADGFSLTWAFGNPMNVTEHRSAVQPSAVKVGAEVGLIGTKDGGTTTARRIVIR
jgi:hypothetical protein